MLDNKMMEILTYWDGISLGDRETFLSSSCIELVKSMVEAKDEKGLEVLRKNLITLADFTDTMQFELEMQLRRTKITQKIKSLYSYIQKNGLNNNAVSSLEELTEDVRGYVLTQQTEEDDEKAEEDAYSNIKALITQNADNGEDCVSVAEVLPNVLSQVSPDKQTSDTACKTAGA